MPLLLRDGTDGYAALGRCTVGRQGPHVLLGILDTPHTTLPHHRHPRAHAHTPPPPPNCILFLLVTRKTQRTALAFWRVEIVDFVFCAHLASNSFSLLGYEIHSYAERQFFKRTTSAVPTRVRARARHQTSNQQSQYNQPLYSTAPPNNRAHSLWITYSTRTCLCAMFIIKPHELGAHTGKTKPTTPSPTALCS